MANTGRKIVLTLKRFVNGVLETKSNTMGDADYIAPYEDLTSCPVVYVTDCPEIIATGGTGTVEFEFSLANSVVNNPSIKKINIYVGISGFGTTDRLFVLPNTPANYFHDTITGLVPGNYIIGAQYLDQNDTIVRDCPNIVEIIVS